MLHLHFSNRCETLTALLLARLAVRAGGVFDADTVVVPGAAMRRALTLAIAGERGICANVRFPYLAPWLWQQIRALLPQQAGTAALEPAVLAWRVHALLGDAGWVGAHPRLADYLAGADAVMRFDLAQRIAALFDQYATYRADWLDAWRQGRAAGTGAAMAASRADERWQAALWQRLCALPDAALPGPGGALLAALSALDPGAARAAGLPAQAQVFALPAIAPLHLAWLQQIARLIDVHVYLLNPCREYWFEIVDRRRLSWLAARGRDQGHEEGNRLLAAWGRQTQAQIDLLVDRCGEAATDDAAFEPAAGGTLLAQVQNAILDLSEPAPGSLGLDAADRSIELHVCHSLTRELEVLHDRLLGLIGAGAVSQPGQVLVVTPDLEAAAPLIDAVFGTAPPERRIPYTISGRARSGVNVPARTLLALLDLTASRFAASEVFDLLQQDIVARRFGLDAEDLRHLHAWLQDAAVRWGLDAAQRERLGLPARAEHTWAQALERLFLGHALPSAVDEPFAGLLPAGDAEGSAALALGALWRYVEALRSLHDALGIARPALAWQALLLETLDIFLAPADDEQDDLAELRAAIAELAQTMRRGGADDDGAPPVALPVLRRALELQLDEPAHGGVPGGAVNFSAMNPLRGLPFEVVCIIGLDDGAFPSAQRAAEFDLIAQQPRRGDRQRRDDERNLFLDLLLAARRCLHLSHSGRSQRDNAPLPPSVLVADLLDLLVPAIAADPVSAASLAAARSRLVVEHPLQPFAAEAFAVDGDRRLRSHDAELAAALRASLRASAPPLPASVAADEEDDSGDPDDDATVDDAGSQPLFFAAPLPPPEPAWRETTLAQLLEFFRNPSRYLLRRRLGIDLGQADDELQDDEPFIADWTGRRALAARVLEPLCAGADPGAVRRLAIAGQDLPAGALGERQLDTELQALAAFAARIRADTAPPCLPPHHARFEATLDDEAWALSASFADLRPQGLARWRADELRPTDILEAWITHLLLCASPCAGAAAQTRWLAFDTTLSFTTQTQARDRLIELLHLYRRGLRRPLEFFPKAAWAYVENDGSMHSADLVWTPTKDKPWAEGADPAYRLALRGRVDPLAGAFAELALRIFGPVKEALGDGG